MSVQGFIVGALGVSPAPFLELWDPSGSIFGSFGRLRRLLGALGEAPRAPRAAWMSPGVDFGIQKGAKIRKKTIPKLLKNQLENQVHFQWIFN